MLLVKKIQLRKYFFNINSKEKCSHIIHRPPKCWARAITRFAPPPLRQPIYYHYISTVGSLPANNLSTLLDAFENLWALFRRFWTL